jgi:hypothetical protein
MATDTERLAARIVLRAVLPVAKVMLTDDPKTKARFEGINATVQFVARENGEEPMGAWLKFEDGALSIGWDLVEDPDIQFTFSSIAKMNGFFTGKPVLPKIKGITKIGLLIKVFSVLLGLKILMPESKPKNADQARLKVKMTLYMVSTALSQLNKAGDPDMVKFTTRQPERIYQWSVQGEDIACYLRIKAGKTKAGRGEYTRRKPFVHMKFRSVEDALPILTNSIGLVEAMSTGMVENEGSPEYGGKIGDFMFKIAALVS